MQEKNFAEWLQQLKYKCNIVDVAGSYINLNQKGSRHWGCCPFHHEKTPSFCVSEDSQFYHCFGCGVSGDVIKFVQEMESQDFMGAVRVLAEKCNMEVPQFSQKSNITEIKAKKDVLYALMREAYIHYYKNLRNAPEAKVARDYLQNRGFGEEILKTFAMGYSLGYDHLVKHLSAKGYSTQQMFECGLVDEKNGKYYDALFSRLIIPIVNSFNQIIAFGGRVLEKTDFAKYKNTKETVLFEKNKELYGIHTLKEFKQKNKVDYVIMVEGYMDVIALNNAGIGNCVASMGTSLTTEQAKVLRRYSTNVVISYDGDSAGQKATQRGLDILQEAGLNVKVASMPEGLDPDEVIARKGVDSYKKLLQDALPLMEYKIKTLAKDYNMQVADEQAKFVIKATELLKTTSTVVEREAYLPLVKELSGLPFDTIQRQLYTTGEVVKKEQPFFEKQQVKETAQMQGVRFILFSLFNTEPFVNEKDDICPYLLNDEHKVLYNIYRQAKDEKVNIDLSMLFDLEGNAEAKEIEKLRDTLKLDGVEREKFYKQSLKSLREDALKRELQELSALCDKETDVQKKHELKMQILRLSLENKK